jgi:hypothetical protein
MLVADVFSFVIISFLTHLGSTVLTSLSSMSHKGTSIHGSVPSTSSKPKPLDKRVKQERSRFKTRAKGTTLGSQDLKNVLSDVVLDVMMQHLQMDGPLPGQREWEEEQTRAQEAHASHKGFECDAKEWSCFECSESMNQDLCRYQAVRTRVGTAWGVGVSPLVDKHVPLETKHREALGRYLVAHMTDLIVHTVLDSSSSDRKKLTERTRGEISNMLLNVEMMVEDIQNGMDVDFDKNKGWSTRHDAKRPDSVPTSFAESDFVVLGNDKIHTSLVEQARQHVDHQGFVCVSTKWRCKTCKIAASLGLTICCT